MSDQRFIIDKNIFMICIAQDSLGQDIALPPTILVMLVIGRGGGGVIILKIGKHKIKCVFCLSFGKYIEKT